MLGKMSSGNPISSFSQNRRKQKPKIPSPLKRIGIGLVITTLAMIIAGVVERQRLKYASKAGEEMSSLSILWQTPQYVLVGVSEAFVYVAQMEFFASQTPCLLRIEELGNWPVHVFFGNGKLCREYHSYSGDEDYNKRWQAWLDSAKFK